MQGERIGVSASAIPIRTFADRAEWDEYRAGFVEIDLAACCEDTTEGFYLNTLTAVDIATGWVECRVVWEKGQQRVGGAVHEIGRQLPFPLVCLALTTARRSSTTTCTPTAKAGASRSRAHVRTARTTTRARSRRTGR